MDSPFRIGVRSAKALAVPAAILLIAGAALVAAYYHIPEVHTAMGRVAALKRGYGVLFVVASSTLLAGLAPWLLRMAIPSLRPEKPATELAFSVGWWVFMLIVVDRFYRFLGYVFDDSGLPFGVIVGVKVLCDMFGFTTFFAAPANALAHLWKDAGFDFGAMRRAMGPGWCARLVLPNLIPNYMVWFPGVALVYAMPSELQIPMANIIGCFWALMCLQVAARTKGRVVVEPEIAT